MTETLPGYDTLPVSVIERIGLPESQDQCWLWGGCVVGNGYAGIRLRGRSVRVHRLIYEHIIGAIPEGLELDHLCRVRLCVNPWHLEPVTHLVNMQRGVIATKTECCRGHAFTLENTYRYGERRHCRECVRIRLRKSKAKRRQHVSST